MPVRLLGLDGRAGDVGREANGDALGEACLSGGGRDSGLNIGDGDGASSNSSVDDSETVDGSGESTTGISTGLLGFCSSWRLSLRSLWRSLWRSSWRSISSRNVSFPRCGEDRVECGDGMLIWCGDDHIGCGDDHGDIGIRVSIGCGDDRVRCGDDHIWCGDNHVGCGDNHPRCGDGMPSRCADDLIHHVTESAGPLRFSVKTPSVCQRSSGDTRQDICIYESPVSKDPRYPLSWSDSTDVICHNLVTVSIVVNGLGETIVLLPVVKKVINQKRCKRPAESDLDVASVVRELLDDLVDCAAEGKRYCDKGVTKKGAASQPNRSNTRVTTENSAGSQEFLRDRISGVLGTVTSSPTKIATNIRGFLANRLSASISDAGL
ncbi:hypothetical protein GE061_016104 [Apolygus lucorum]|uniref:Uncharacterized protein n=1 Tax=Apolygus lucorum TaxID=248454 RepID=A0A8S9XF93_APOLU|nr:hypothetical protein GE061_016104 [Apolygus lucorum]